MKEKQNPVLPRSMLDHERSFIIEIDFKIQSFLKKDLYKLGNSKFFQLVTKNRQIAWCSKGQDLSLTGSSGASNSKLRSSISILVILLFEVVSGPSAASMFRLRSSVSNCVTRVSGLIFEK